MKKIAITGSNGFIGKSLCKTFSKLNRPIVGIIRSGSSLKSLSDINTAIVGNINSNTNWKKSLENCDVVIHCAGKAHVMNSKDDTYDYYSVNVEGTKNLAEQAVKFGVKKLIFLSSIKVNGENTDKRIIDFDTINRKNFKFSHNHLPNPTDSYAKSKFEAEKILWDISLKTNLEVIVVRLPLVYGPEVKGNLARLIKITKSGLPLPLKSIQNKRSMIGIDNLIDFLIKCVDHPDAIGKTFLISDGEDLSTPDLIKLIAKSINRPVRLFHFPILFLKFFSLFVGRKKEIDRLIGSLQIDTTYSKKILNWKPKISVFEGIRRMVQGK